MVFQVMETVQRFLINGEKYRKKNSIMKTHKSGVNLEKVGNLLFRRGQTIEQELI